MIIVKVQPGGEIKIETSGFTGSSCQDATRRFERALGVAGQGLNRYLGSAEVIQALANQLQAGKQTRVFLVVLAPTAQLPPELEKMFLCLQHQLPDHDELRELAQGLVTADEFPDGLALGSLLDAASGLTRNEAENAFSLSLVRENRLTVGSRPSITMR